MFPHSRRLLVAFVAILSLAASVSRLFGYALEGPSWPTGSTVNVRLAFTGPASGHLQDGFTTFNASAADALVLWNQQIQLAKFSWTTSSFGGSQGDGQNTAFFSSTVYGQTYGLAIAVTIYFYNGSTMHEADNLFNSALLWDSYRGPLQYNSKKQKYIFDFHRVALHEFGHTLGLAHPDDAGQTVTAIMNHIISNLDSLAADDISGIKFLYAPRISSWLIQPSVLVGDSFSYQITANNNPTSYSASNLPTGLQINTATGLISGNPTISGTFNVTISATSALGTASGLLTLVVLPPQITSATTLYSVPIATPFSYRITATNNPTSFTARGLPPGLTLDSETGSITGIPTAAGEFIIQVGANTSYGTAAAQVHVFILPPQITSLGAIICSSGDAVNYQITAQFSPTGYACSLLPAGLTFDSTTGTISGVATVGGNYIVTVTAHTAWGDASRQVQIIVAQSSSIPDNLDALVKRVSVGSASVRGIIEDPLRPRIYVVADTGVFVFDTTSLVISPTPLVGGGVADAWIGADRATLWCVAYDGIISRVNLDMQTVTQITSRQTGNQIRDGLNGRMYVADVTGVLQIDGSSGAVQQNFGGDGTTIIEISHDRKTLYVAHPFTPGLTLARYDVSGPVPVAHESIAIPTALTLLTARHDDRSLCVASFTDPFPTPVSEYSATNLTIRSGVFRSPWSALTEAFSFDDSQFFLGAQAFFSFHPSKGWIGVFDAGTRTLTRTITMPDDYVVPISVTTDSNNSYLYALGGAQLYVYKLFSLPRASSPSLTNVSTRAFTGTGDSFEIGGFVIAGTKPKKVIVRALAPSLQAFGIANALPDPLLELHNSTGAVVATNDNWKFDRQKVLETGIPPGDEHESAIVTTLAPGSYTAVLRGVYGRTGVALFELYDLDPQSSKIANISTRGNVGTGENVMIGGFIVGGDQPTNVIVRALGPTLTDFGVSGALADPTLELHNGNGTVIAQNDDWKSTQQQAIQNSGYAPPKDAEAAIMATLQPGNYTAIVRGKDNTTGVALVEVYNLDAN